MHGLKIIGKSFNLLSKDVPRMNLKSSLEMLMKGNANLGTMQVSDG